MKFFFAFHLILITAFVSSSVEAQESKSNTATPPENNITANQSYIGQTFALNKNYFAKTCTIEGAESGSPILLQKTWVFTVVFIPKDNKGYVIQFLPFTSPRKADKKDVNAKNAKYGKDGDTDVYYFILLSAFDGLVK